MMKMTRRESCTRREERVIRERRTRSFLELFVIATSAAIVGTTIPTTTTTNALEWNYQNLGQPFGGHHSGIAIYDMNGDGFQDLIFAAGRHSLDTSYVLINLGLKQTTKDTTDPKLEILFSDPIPLRYGTYNQVDVSALSSLDENNHVAVLLAGGTCTDVGRCGFGYIEPAVVLDVSITGCSVYEPTTPCKLNGMEIDISKTKDLVDNPELLAAAPVIWIESFDLLDSENIGNRDGLFSHELGNGIDPAIVLVGTGCLSIYHPTPGNSNKTPFSVFPDFTLSTEEKVVEFNDGIARSSGVAAGMIGQQPGVVMSTRAKSRLAHLGVTPLVVVTQSKNSNDDEGNTGSTGTQDPSRFTYSHWQVDGDQPRRYNGQEYSLEATDVVLADVNGDGNVDIIPANYKIEYLVDNSVGINHTVFLVDENPEDDTPLAETFLFSTRQAARSLTTGQLYEDSNLPDLVYGMNDGSLYVLANLHDTNSNNDQTAFGFEIKDVITLPTICSIRDVKVADSLAPCTKAIVTAVTCGSVEKYSENSIHIAAVPCPDISTPEPTPQPVVENVCNVCPADNDGTVRCLQNPNEMINLATQPGYDGTKTCGAWETQGLVTGIVPFRCTTFKNAVQNDGACGGCGTSCST